MSKWDAMTAEERRAKFGHGPRPKPTEVKVLEGNPGGYKLNRNELKPTRTRVEPPFELNDDAYKEWKRIEDELHRMGLLTAVDMPALANYCQIWSVWCATQRGLNKIMAEDPNFITNPALKASLKVSYALTRVCAELGFSPSSRSKVTVTDDNEASKFKGLIATG